MNYLMLVLTKLFLNIVECLKVSLTRIVVTTLRRVCLGDSGSGFSRQ